MSSGLEAIYNFELALAACGLLRTAQGERPDIS